MTKRTLTIELPWPNRALSPNGRIDRFSKARIFKSTKMQAFIVTKTALKGQPVRLRDEDNLIANCKSYFDGIAEALNVNDHLFHFREQVWHPDEAPGKLLIELDWEEPNE